MAAGRSPGPARGHAQPERQHCAVDESVRSRPAAALRPFIAYYSGFRQAGIGPATHRGLPSPYLTLIFTLDDPLTLARHPDPRQPPGSYAALVGGLHTAPALITHQGSQSGVQVALSPLGARRLLGVPAGELTDINLDAADLLGPLAAQVSEQMRAAPGWPARFAVVSDALLGRLAAAPERPGTSAEVRLAWRRLLRSGGRCRIRDLADEDGWSDRHLRAAFRAQIGLTPKAAARVVRFSRARRLLLAQAASGSQPLLADLAAECGFADQAHLAREFRALAGCPPSQWLAEEFRNIQAWHPAALTGSRL